MIIIRPKKIQVSKLDKILRTFFGFSLTVFSLGLILFCFTYLLPPTPVVRAEVLHTASVSVSGPVQEVHIANNGMVYLQGARVQSVSGTTIVVSTSWNNVNLSWIINTNGSYYGARHFGTSVLDSKGNQLTVTDVSVGNIITVSGVLDVDSTLLTVKADVVRI